MDIIKTGIGIGRTIRNVARLKQIIAVFAAHGFQEFIGGKFTSIIPDFVLPKSQKLLKEEFKKREQIHWPVIVGERLRLSFEELGPLFIKFGQFLSLREDMFSKGFISEMKKLRDQTAGIPFSEVKIIVEKSLGCRIEDKFLEFAEESVGNASIGVVHRAVLKSGENVVVKIRRPNILKQIATDGSILLILVEQAEKLSDYIKYLGMKRLVIDFISGINSEVNFYLEAMNIEQFSNNIKNYGGDQFIFVPKVYGEFTAENILVMDYVDGVSFSNTDEIMKLREQLNEDFRKILTIIIKTFLTDGLFHADLHGGNFFLMKDGRVGIIDFGLVGILSKRDRINFCTILYALLTKNYEHLVYEFLDMAEYDKLPNTDDLITDIRDQLNPFLGLTTTQVDYNKVFKTLIKTLNKHKLYLPREWFLVFRAFAIMDGVSRSIKLDFNIYEILEDDIKSIIKDTISVKDLVEDSFWISKGLFSLMKILPRHMKWYLKDFSQNNYAHKVIHTGYNKEIKSISSSIIFLGYIILSSVFFFSGITVLEIPILSIRDISVISWICWFLSFSVFIRAMLNAIKS